VQPEFLFFQWSKRLALGAFALAILMLILAGATCLQVPRTRGAPSAAMAPDTNASRRPVGLVGFPPTNPQTSAGLDSPRSVATVHAVEQENGAVPATSAPLSGNPANRARAGPICALAPTPSTKGKAQLQLSENRGPKAVGQAGLKAKPKHDGTNGWLAFLKLRTPVLHQAQLRDGTQQQNLIDLPGAICPHSEFVERHISPRLAILSFETNAQNASSQLTLLDGIYREVIRRDQRRISLLGGLVAFGGTPTSSNTFRLFWIAL